MAINMVVKGKKRITNLNAANLKIEESLFSNEESPTTQQVDDSSKMQFSLSADNEPTNNAEPAEAKDEPTTSSTRKRVRMEEKSIISNVVSSSLVPKTTKNVKKKKNDPETQFETSWICVECKEAECGMVLNDNDDVDNLLICDGVCQRLFHYPCAGLSKLPSETETFICNDCIVSQHSCCICQTYGIDNEDVFKCSKSTCGLFFHEACLDMMPNIEVKVFVDDEIIHDNNGVTIDPIIKSDETPVKSEITNTNLLLCTPPAEKRVKRMFVCPAHDCWTCSQLDTCEPEVQDNNHDEDNHGSIALYNDDDTVAGTTLLPATLLSLPVSSSSSKKFSINHNNKKSKKRAKSAAKKIGMFEKKKEHWLQRCIICPISYHISCIPPSARFHELALLCHEHSSSNKLPDLNMDESVQNQIEHTIDKKLHKSLKQKSSSTKLRSNKQKQNGTMIKHNKDKILNPFFPGLMGISPISNEFRLLEQFQQKFDDYVQKKLFFCLPCDLKDEVYVKPPVYKHIQTNQYDPVHRPPKVSTSDIEMCECTGFCADDCLNRTLYVECYGDNTNGNTNCNVGPGCGNRLFSQRKFVRCKPKREEGKGWGLATIEPVKRGELIIEYVGEIIDAETKEKRLTEWTIQHPNDPNFYIMALQPGWFIDAREKANLSRFINHSCEPNGMLVPINVFGRIRCGIIATRDIVAGEFLSYDYHFDTRYGDKFVCRCGSLHCKGTMQAGNGNKKNGTTDSNKTKNKMERYEEAKIFFERDKKFVQEYYEDSQRRCSLVAETVPYTGETTTDELVAAGPQRQYRSKVIGSRIFLWRNVELGSNFASRFHRIDHRPKQQQQKEK